MERVLGTVRDSSDDAPETEIVNLHVRPSPGAMAQTVQVITGAADPHEDASEPDRSEDDRYESDRRGEHTYPRDGEQRPPRSHRERAALRSRLERRG